MTNKEVVEQLLAIKKLGCLTDKDRQALELAIKALEFQDNVKEAYYSSTGCFELKNYIRELLKGEEE